MLSFMPIGPKWGARGIHTDTQTHRHTDRQSSFYYIDDNGGALHKARALMSVRSTKPEGANRPGCECESQRLGERSNRECERKAQSLRV